MELQRRIRAAWIVAITLVFALMGGVALASIPDADGVIHACYKLNAPDRNSLRVVDTEAGQTCPTGWAALDWNRTGPQGPPGPMGPPGITATQRAEATASLAVTEDNRYNLATQVVCPTGTYATGGGGGTQGNDPRPFFLKESSPLLDTGVPRGWRVVLGYSGGPTANVDIAVFAICTT